MLKGRATRMLRFPRVIIRDGANHYLQLPSLTTTQRDALTPVAGMLIYNSTLTSVQSYEAGAWGDVAAGEITTHAALFGLHTQVVIKTADQTVNNSTVLVDDTHLLVPIAANEVKLIRYILLDIGSVTAGFRMNITAPTGATGEYYAWNGSVYAKRDIGSVTGDLGAEASKNLRVAAEAIVINGATAGNVQLQWAQSTATVVDTIVHQNSCLIATKLA